MDEIINSATALHSICVDGGSDDANNWLEYLAGNIVGGNTTDWEDDDKWQTMYDAMDNASDLFDKTYYTDACSDCTKDRTGDHITLIESAHSSDFSDSYDLSITPNYSGCYSKSKSYNWSTEKHIMWGGHESWHDNNDVDDCVVKHYLFEPII